MALQPRACGNPECSFTADGKCVEAYELEECPHLHAISIDEFKTVDEATVAREAVAVLALASGEVLNRSQASDIQRRRVSRSIGLIGPNNAGKTSLIAGVYDLLQEGPLAGVSFAGSSTLVGFEKICHDARVVSRRGQPHTERTTVGVDVTFFHLDLRPAGGDVISLLIGDRSGEDYLGATDMLSRADEFFELRRADTVTLLVNGEQLADSGERHQVKAITHQMVDALVEGKAIRSKCRLAIVMTKQDAVLMSPHAQRATREFEEMVTAIAERHRYHLAEVQPFMVAASPKDTANVHRGEGLDKLVLYWIRSGEPRALSSALVPCPVAETRMIDLLTFGAKGHL